jgi:hypothetical protein
LAGGCRVGKRALSWEALHLPWSDRDGLRVAWATSLALIPAAFDIASSFRSAPGGATWRKNRSPRCRSTVAFLICPTLGARAFASEANDQQHPSVDGSIQRSTNVALWAGRGRERLDLYGMVVPKSLQNRLANSNLVRPDR